MNNWHLTITFLTSSACYSFGLGLLFHDFITSDSSNIQLLVHPNKSPLNFWRKGSVGVSRDCPIFLRDPLLSQERDKLLISNLAGIFTGSIAAKSHYEF